MVVGYTTLSHMQPLNYCNSTLNTSGIILILLDSSEKRSKELISLEDGYVKRKNQVKFNNNNPLWIWAQNLWWTTMHISVGWRTVIKIGQYLFLEKKKKRVHTFIGTFHPTSSCVFKFCHRLKNQLPLKNFRARRFFKVLLESRQDALVLLGLWLRQDPSYWKSYCVPIGESQGSYTISRHRCVTGPGKDEDGSRGKSRLSCKVCQILFWNSTLNVISLALEVKLSHIEVKTNLC